MRWAFLTLAVISVAGMMVFHEPILLAPVFVFALCFLLWPRKPKGWAAKTGQDVKIRHCGGSTYICSVKQVIAPSTLVLHSGEELQHLAFRTDNQFETTQGASGEPRIVRLMAGMREGEVIATIC